MKKLNPKYKRYLVKKSIKGNRPKRLTKTRTHLVSPSKITQNSVYNTFIDLPTPQKFRLQYETCEEVIEYINKLKRIGKSGKHINIIMSETTEIGEGAISMLLSVMEELANNGVLFKGIKPTNLTARSVLEKSGFFKFVNGKVDSTNTSTKNTILRTGDNTTSYNELANEIINSMETIWGVKGRSPSVYSCVFEMMRNSCDHAFRHNYQIKWHFAISHSEEDNLVKFAFVDNGSGIIKTFTNGILKRFVNLFQDNLDIIDSAFKNGIKSRTGLNWRGKGLPTIYEHYEENYVKNLVVISNNVYIDFDRNIRHILKNEFSGTYYYWKVNQECVKECFPINK
jgi:hypothetical protein